MILYKEIKLLPTAFALDVWVSEDLEGMYDVFKNMYNVIGEEIQLNQVGTVETGSETLFEGQTRIYMVLEGFDPAIMAHEVSHTVWHLSNCSGVELNYHSQEWNACMIETIMDECLEQESFERYD